MILRDHPAKVPARRGGRYLGTHNRFRSVLVHEQRAGRNRTSRSGGGREVAEAGKRPTGREQAIPTRTTKSADRIFKKKTDEEEEQERSRKRGSERGSELSKGDQAEDRQEEKLSKKRRTKWFKGHRGSLARG